jgi:hypothetical protein
LAELEHDNAETALLSCLASDLKAHCDGMVSGAEAIVRSTRGHSAW